MIRTGCRRGRTATRATRWCSTSPGTACRSWTRTATRWTATTRRSARWTSRTRARSWTTRSTTPSSVRPLGPGVKLHAIIDTCHSGTILDLCRISRTGYWQWENHTRQPQKPKGTSGGLAISISGCNDDQKSADSSGFSDSAAIGAMTDSFIKAVQSEPGTTYGQLLSAMRGTIREADAASCPAGSAPSSAR